MRFRTLSCVVGLLALLLLGLVGGQVLAQAPGLSQASANAFEGPLPVPFLKYAQEAYVKAQASGPRDFFGTTVAVSGDTLVVGAPDEDPSPNSVNRIGAVHVYVRSSRGWIQQARLVSPDPELFSRFGEAVAIDGDILAVGAPRVGGSPIPVRNSGAVYVFERRGGLWSSEAFLRAPSPSDGALFGTSVAVSGPRVVVGAPFEDRGPGLEEAGAVYLFARDSRWELVRSFRASNQGLGDHFGAGVALSGNLLAVGADQERSLASGIGGGQGDDTTLAVGAVYVFDENRDWIQEAYIKASNPDPGDRFGGSVGLSGNTLVVGARGEASDATGVNGAQGNHPLFGGAGAAYVFVRNGGVWSQQAYLKASNTSPGDRFGDAVALSGDLVVVGAANEDSGGTGVDPLPVQDRADSGVAYVFRRFVTEWKQDAFVKASNTDSNDGFGTSVAISGGTFAIGAAGEDSAASGVNGDPGNLLPEGRDSGAAYVLISLE